ncbi:unnamed protein product [Polarella glacialis]|uniref:Uncharacterized protein n=1 Tax=Polarella glacialis TaxID=89957 RepID=A0A813GC71_POLGL|nr:unnamed protein product [Polarella glacialis]
MYGYNDQPIAEVQGEVLDSMAELLLGATTSRAVMLHVLWRLLCAPTLPLQRDMLNVGTDEEDALVNRRDEPVFHKLRKVFDSLVPEPTGDMREATSSSKLDSLHSMATLRGYLLRCDCF